MTRQEAIKLMVTARAQWERSTSAAVIDAAEIAFRARSYEECEAALAVLLSEPDRKYAPTTSDFFRVLIKRDAEKKVDRKLVELNRRA